MRVPPACRKAGFPLRGRALFRALFYFSPLKQAEDRGCESRLPAERQVFRSGEELFSELFFIFSPLKQAENHGCESRLPAERQVSRSGEELFSEFFIFFLSCILIRLSYLSSSPYAISRTVHLIVSS